MSLDDQAREAVAASQREEQASQAEDLLTVKEYADLHRVHIQTVYSAIRQGHRLNGRVERPTPRTIRIAVPRGSIQRLRSA